MKKISIIMLIFLLNIFVIPAISTNLNVSSTVKAASVKINKTKKVLHKGQGYTLKIKGTSKKVKWSSSDKKIAKVSSKGRVKAKKNGIAYITARVGKKKYKCKIEVKKWSKGKVVVTKIQKVGTRVVAIFKNNNDYAVSFRPKAKFYNKKGKRIGKVSERYNFAFEPNSECVIKFYCENNKSKEVNFDTFNLDFGKIETTTEKYHNAGVVKVTKVAKEKERYVVTIKNTGGRWLSFVNVAVVWFDKNGKIIEENSRSVHTYSLYGGQSYDAKIDFPRDKYDVGGKIININAKAKSYRVFVNYAYTYTN